MTLYSDDFSLRQFDVSTTEDFPNRRDSSDDSFQNCSFENSLHKTIRKNQKDAFDYQTYIAQQLEKLGGSRMSEGEKKQAVVRIRNRMSAQRSRNRQRSRFSEIADVNQSLRQENLSLTNENKLLKDELAVAIHRRDLCGHQIAAENNALKEQIFARMTEEKLLKDKIAALEGENERLRREKELQFVRENVAGAKTNLTKTVLFFFALVAFSVMFIGGSDAKGLKTAGISFAAPASVSKTFAPCFKTHSRNRISELLSRQLDSVAAAKDAPKRPNEEFYGCRDDAESFQQ